MNSKQSHLLGPLLRDVSRAFYLTLRVLPRKIRPQISLAYLLARASDTIADTKSVRREQRIGLLQQLRDGDVGATFLSRVSVIAESRQECRSHGETALLRRVGECVAALKRLDDSDAEVVRRLLHTIITGQIFDLEKFPGESERELVALATDEELDRYTYMVAGCVGEFWTRMCAAHLRELECWSIGEMEELGIRFGKGLQLVNILRDMPGDLRIGRCYLPVNEPQALLDAANFEAVRGLYVRWLDVAVEHLDAGWQYTMQIPASLWRLRLACIWPIWIGLKTIGRLRRSNPLARTTPVKISRAEVYRLMLRSFLSCRSDGALNGYFQRLRRVASGQPV